MGWRVVNWVGGLLIGLGVVEWVGGLLIGLGGLLIGLESC